MSNEWKMVPVEPTKEQALAVCMHPDLARVLYRSMVSAAPLPPAGDAEVLGCAIKDYPYSLRHSRSELDKLTIPFADDQIVELVDRAHVTRLTAECDALLSEVERLNQQLLQKSSVLQATEGLWDEAQSELTKARELFEDMLRDDDMPVHWFAQRISEITDAPAAKGGE